MQTQQIESSQFKKNIKSNGKIKLKYKVNLLGRIYLITTRGKQEDMTVSLCHVAFSSPI